MEMSFQQYIDNPLGKKNAVFSQRDMYRGMYTEKFDKLLLREAGEFKYTMYVDEKHDRYIMHMKIPSESVKNFYYDSVILFYTDNPAVHSSNSIINYGVKFFSNDPAFVYTYLRVFLKNDMFFEDMKPKASKIARKKDPREKNPYELPGYSKILYFTYLYMKAKNLFAKHMWQTYGQKYSVSRLLSQVEHTDVKIAKGQELGKKQKEENKKNVRTARVQKNADRFDKLPKTAGGIVQDGVRTTRTVKTAKKAPTVKTASRAKQVKRK